MEERELTLGEKRVRINFNVSGDSDIDKIKRTAADGIDYLESLKTGASSEKIRLIALAQTSYEEWSQWSVKALTI
jgi:hypothetical protein